MKDQIKKQAIEEMCKNCVHNELCEVMLKLYRIVKVPPRMCKFYEDNAGYRKQSEGCEFCKDGDEKCGTCKKMYEGMDGCSSDCNTEKCVAYKPVNYCFMCGRELKGADDEKTMA